jgi:hypothetical protein
LYRKLILNLLLFIAIGFGFSYFDYKSTQAVGIVPVELEDDFSTNSGKWDYLGSATRTGGTVQLTPPAQGQAGVIWLKDPIAPPYDVSFRMKMSNHSFELLHAVPADGIVFMFNKNKTDHLPSGSQMGFETGNGYGVEFDTFYNNGSSYDLVGGDHISLFKNNANSGTATNLLQQVLSPSNMTNGQWHNVKIEVRKNSVRVYMNNELYIEKSLELDSTYSYLGFSASTGYYYSRQEIDDVSITDRTIPEITFQVTPSATLGQPNAHLSLTDAGGLTGAMMRFSVNNGDSWSTWEPFKEHTALTLPSVTASTNVQAQVKDLAGNESTPVNVTLHAPVAVLSPQSIHHIQGQPLIGTLGAHDPDGDSITYYIQEGTSTRGTTILENSFTGAFRYTPNTTTVGSDSFQYYVTDGILQSNIYDVYIHTDPLEIAPQITSITTLPDPSMPTNSPKITVAFSIEAYPTTIKWLPGEVHVSSFLNDGYDIPGHTFEVTNNGWYTVYAANEFGYDLKSINITHFDHEDPELQLNDSNYITIWQTDTGIFEDPGYIATDNDSPPITTVSGSVNAAVTGTYVLTYTTTDRAGNSSTATRTVEVLARSDNANLSSLTVDDKSIIGFDPDTLAYTMYVPSVTTSINVEYTQADSHAAVLIKQPADNMLAVGPNEISLTVTAHSGATKIYTLNVVRLLDPVIGAIGFNPSASYSTTGDVTVSAVVEGPSLSMYKWMLGSVSPADIATGGTPITSPAFTVSENGTYTLYAVNEAGGYAIQHITVNQIDRKAPLISLNGSASITISQGETYIDQGVTVSDHENPADPAVTLNGAVDTNVPNTYELTYTATDLAGNTAWVVRYVHVLSNNANLSSLTVDGKPIGFDPDKLTYTMYVPYVTTTVNVDYALADPHAIVLIKQPADNLLAVGPNEISIMVTAHSNATKIYTLNVVRLLDPVIGEINFNPSASYSTKGDVTVSAVVEGPSLTMYKWMPGSASPADIGTGGTPIPSPTFTVSENGTYTLYAVNEAGGYAIQHISVNQIDRKAPVISLNGPASITIPQGENYIDQGVTVSDHDNTADPTVTLNGAVDTNVPNTYELTYTVTDLAGNTDWVVRYVQVLSNNANLSNLTVDGKSIGFNPDTLTYTMYVPYVTASVNVDYALADSHATVLIKQPADNVLAVGPNEISLTVTAHSGATKTYTLNVVRLLDPVIGAIGFNPSASYSTKGDVTVSAVVEGPSLTMYKWMSGLASPEDIIARGTLIPSPTFTVSENGTYTLFAVNEAGGYAIQHITVNQIDLKVPVISLKGPESITIPQGETYIDPGVTVSDHENPADPAITLNGMVNTSVPGTYELTYTATDLAGNTAWAVRYVHVLSSNAYLSSLTVDGKTIGFDPDTLAYTMYVPYVTTSVNVEYTQADSHATVLIKQPADNLLAVGPNEISLTVTAHSGATKIYTLNVVRLLDPVIGTISFNPSASYSTTGNVTVNAVVEGPTPTMFKWMPGSASPADIGTGGTPIPSPTFTVSENGTYTLYAVNEAGGYAIQHITVNQIDRIAPLLSLSESSSNHIYTKLGMPYPIPEFIMSDPSPSSGNLPVLLEPIGSVNLTVAGDYPLTYRAKDLAGNTSEPIIVTVHVMPLNSNAYLGSLSVDGYGIPFDMNQSHYTVSVSYDTLAVQIHAQPADSQHANAVISGSYNTLAVGPNIITILVTAEDSSTKEYTIVVTREELAAPTIVNISTNPLPGTPTSGNVTVSAAVYGSYITSFKWLRGNASIEAFATGGNQLPITGGSFQVSENDNYTLYALNDRGRHDLRTVSVQNIDRAAPAIHLKAPSSLTLTQGTSYMEPGYTVIDEVDTADQLIVTIQGTVNTNELGSYKLIYTVRDRAGNSSSAERMVTIVRPLSSNANLSSLLPQDHTLNFLPNVTEYTLLVPYEIASLPISYAVADSSASVTVTGTVYHSTANSVVATLQTGPNVVQWLVTAENNSTKIYTLTITRASSTNAYIEQFSLLDGGGVLSPQFDSRTFDYDLYLPSTSTIYLGSLYLSDPLASFTVTGVTYTVTGATYNPSYIVFDFGNASSFVITVLAADQVTQNNYHFNLQRVTSVTNPIGYARMLDEQTIQLRFQNSVAAHNLQLLDHLIMNGTPATIDGIRSVYTGSQTVQLELELSQPVSPTSSLSISILPGLLKTTDNTPITQLHIPIANQSSIQQIYQALDTEQDGLHVEDILRYIALPNGNKDFNNDGIYDRNDLLFLLSLITTPSGRSD